MDEETAMRVVVSKNFKDRFKEACDGRTMSYVIIKLMKKYIEEAEKED
jgi:hypothetical protein